ncbi:flagellar biosynthesis protein FlgD [Shewanella sp. 202IG2-18]|uniref:flagellar hook assembly protein FlgD n=1 Tax=Parashewanella hymeniacidonis TaxID=2807618 RepID=UPI0019611014|nr:flagellar hook capping FlgD N-terminal domain-containing protein [Parashewanella hymeniacidonis]MBM7072861.1 flagellar biosynthesis protein FlgD [Parashewanella hymeniacidonis]
MQTNAIANSTNQGSDNNIGLNSNDPSALRNEFMTLMIAQINNQDPTDPLDPNEYVSQLAQFSQVESLENVTKNQATQMTMLENLGIVQSANLIGKQAMVPASSFELNEEAIQGKAYLKSSAENLTVEIKNSQGEVVQTLNLGSQDAGDIAFSIDPQALGLPKGDYQINAIVLNGEDTSAADTFLQAEIERVHFSSAKGTMIAELSNGLESTSVLNISEVS